MGLMAIPTIFQRPLTVPCTALTAGKLPAVSAVQGDCESVYLQLPLTTACILSWNINRDVLAITMHGLLWMHAGHWYWGSLMGLGTQSRSKSETVNSVNIISRYIFCCVIRNLWYYAHRRSIIKPGIHNIFKTIWPLNSCFPPLITSYSAIPKDEKQLKLLRKSLFFNLPSG